MFELNERNLLFNIIYGDREIVLDLPHDGTVGKLVRGT